MMIVETAKQGINCVAAIRPLDPSNYFVWPRYRSLYLKENSTVCVDVGPRVLDLASLEQNRRNNLVHIRHELEQRVVGQVLQGKLPLARIARVRLSENGVAVAWHDL